MPFPDRRTAMVCLLIALLAACSNARAGEPVSLQQAFVATLDRHPALQAATYRLAAQSARADLAARRPALEGTLDIENVLGSGALEGADEAEITLGISGLIERGGKRDARIQRAQSATALLTLDERLQALDLLAETARRFVALAVAQQAVEQAQARVEQSRRTLALIVPRVEAARSPPTERLNAEIDASAAETALATANSELATARYALALQWNDPAARPTVIADLQALPATESFESLAQRLERVPDFHRFAAEERVHEAQLRLAQSEGVADWRWNAGVRRLQGFDEQALVLGIAVPFGAARRSEPLRREAQHLAAETPLRRQTRQLELLQTLHAQWQALQQARQLHEAIANRQLALAHEALDLTERGYHIGRFGYRELAAAQQQVLTLDAQALDATARYHLTRIEIERLTGAQLHLLEERAP